MWKNRNAYICDQKCLVWAFFTKKPYSDIFALEFEKNYCHIWNQHPQILVMRKVCEKTKIPKLGSKNALFWCFWGRTLKSYSHIWNRHRWIRIIAKFCEETKMPKVGTKNALFGHFLPKWLIWIFLGQNFKNSIVIFEISTVKFC